MITKSASTLIKEAGLKADVVLRPHQENAIDNLLKKDGNIILSHPVGSGKTISGIAGFERLRQQGKAKRALVVTPASLRENFAEKGVKKFTDDDYVIYGNKQEVASGAHNVVDPNLSKASTAPTYGIVSYDMFRKDPEKYLKAHDADTVIYDEIHRIKNDASATFKALKENRDKFKNFIGMTGSVVSNTPADVVPIIDAMTGGKHRLGTKASFESRFLSIDKDKEERKLRNPIMVRSLIAPYVHHVTKEQIESSAGKPPKKKVKYVDVLMSEEQAALYRLAIDKLDPVTKAKLRMGAGKLSNAELKGIFSKLMKSRQVANSLTGLYTNMPLEEAAKKTPKVKKLLDDVQAHIRQTPDAQVVIHSNLLSSGLDVIEAGLKERGVKFDKFIGKGNKGITEASRQKAVEDYNAGKTKVLLISSAGGEGIDLPNTTMFASLDGHYNPEKINQAEARGIRAGGLAHRPEKDRVVQVNRYRSVLPRSKVETAWKAYEAINPMTYVGRAINGEKLWQSPLDRTPSVDEIIYRIALSKDKANQQLRGQFDKTGAYKNPYMAPGYRSDAPILKDYYSEFGDRLLTGDYHEDWIDEDAERKYVNNLRQYYNSVKRSNEYVKRLGKDDVVKFQHLDDESALRKHYLKESFKNSLPLSLMLMASPAVDVISDFRDLSGKKGALLKALSKNKGGIATRLAMAGGLAGLETAFTIGGAKKVHTPTSMAEARRRSKMKDDDLLKLLRGDVVETVKVKKTDEFI